ncbi:MAG: DUF3240 family protein [Pseudomonadales bacterium]|jgi:hypothetical protein|nr:DUF3240 family protein [Pseudomonadales bacterium]
MTDHEKLTLVAPPALEDALLEALLEHPATESFSSSPGRGHGAHPDRMTLAEQVSGWRREIRVEVLLRREDRDGLLATLRERFATDSVRWWAVPVVDRGSLAPERDRSAVLEDDGGPGGS